MSIISKPNVRKNLKNIIGTVMFWFLFVCLFMMLVGIFANAQRPDENGYEKRITYAYRGEPKNTIDVMVIGNSDAYRGFSPLDFYKETGVTAAVSGEPKRNVQGVCKVVKDVLKYQKPKYIVLETDCVFDGWNKTKQPRKRIPIANFKVKNKFDWKSWDSAIVTGLNYEIPLMRHHDNWKKLNFSSFFDVKTKYYRYANKGMAYSSKTKEFCQSPEYMNFNPGKRGKLTKSDIKAMRELIELCRKNDITPIFVTVPSANSWNNIKSIAIQKMADKHGLIYYDFNQLLPKGFDWNRHSKDGGNHLNYQGAKLLTKNFAQVLKQDFELEPTKLTAKQKRQWEADYKYFHEEIAKDLGSKK